MRIKEQAEETQRPTRLPAAGQPGTRNPAGEPHQKPNPVHQAQTDRKHAPGTQITVVDPGKPKCQAQLQV